MNKQYKHLMDQQDIGAEVTAQFYDTLNKAKTDRRSVRWGALIAAACLALMIPLTVFAVNNLFSAPEVKLGKLDWHQSPNGYSVRFENVESFSPEAFSEDVRALKDHKTVACDSWEAAEAALGIDLLQNTYLTEEKADTVSFAGLGQIKGKILYSQQDGKLNFVAATNYYRQAQLPLEMKAKLAVDHPGMDEDAKQALLGAEGVALLPGDTGISTESYTTGEGIPVAILRWDRGQVIQYSAFFAVNNVAYEVTAWVSPEGEAEEKQILLAALEGFKLP